MVLARIFVSYSHGGRGDQWKELLVGCFSVFEQLDLLDIWQDGKLRLASLWDDDIRSSMASADAALVMLTAETLKSEYILEVEFPVLQKRQREDGLPIYLVVCEECDWNSHPWLHSTQAAGGAVPLEHLDDLSQRRELNKVVNDVISRLGSAALARYERAGDEESFLGRVGGAGASLVRSNGAEPFVGREQEIGVLDLAFAQPETAVVAVVAWGGVGKSALARQWLRKLRNDGWPGVSGVYVWTFHGADHDVRRQSEEDAFFADALEWFGVKVSQSLSGREKGRLLAEAVKRSSALLVLDGLEPMQFPPGPMGGRLRSAGIEMLLSHLASLASAETQLSSSSLERCLCLVTTRETLVDLAPVRRRPGVKRGAYVQIELSSLSDSAGASLLYTSGVQRAGAAKIQESDPELLAASRELDGHALTLNLLGRFLARAHLGDIRRRDRVRLSTTDSAGGALTGVLGAFELWFEGNAELGHRQLALLRALSLFDRPADELSLKALRQLPAISDMTDGLFTEASATGPMARPIADEDLMVALSFLEDFRLVRAIPVQPESIRGFDTVTTVAMRQLGPGFGLELEHEPIDRRTQFELHPLVRSYFLEGVQGRNPEGAKAAHQRVYNHLVGQVPFWPTGIAALMPLYQAVYHGCKAGLHEKARTEVYRDRILRSTSGPCGNYSTFSLGAVASDVAALANFFEEPWSVPVSSLSDSAASWVLSEAAFRLRGLGRMVEAVEPVKAAAELSVHLDDSNNATIDHGNLSEVYLLLGELDAALVASETAIDFADRTRDEPAVTLEAHHWAIHMRARSADILFRLDRIEEARDLYERAESMQAKAQPDYPLLYSESGFRYCEFLLRDAARASWVIASSLVPRKGLSSPSTHGACWSVERRSARCMNWLGDESTILSIARQQLTTVTAQFYRALIDDYDSPGDEVSGPILRSRVDSLCRLMDQVVEGVSVGSLVEFLPSPLMLRSRMRALVGDSLGACSDLDEAWAIAERGSMRLAMADIYLHRARLFFRSSPYPWGSPREDVELARNLIDVCNYRQRRGELDDIEVLVD